MNLRPISVFAAMALAAALMLSCSGGNRSAGSVTAPDLAAGKSAPVENRQLWGYWEISVDPVTLEATVVPQRLAEDHWNTRKWLENGPCDDCLQVLSVQNPGDGTTEFEVQLTHPFSNPNLTGFDVRGIPVFDYGTSFGTGLHVPARESGKGELVNAEGYTYLYCSATAGQGPGGLQGYSKGYYASTEMPDATINGYLRFKSDDPANTRCAFYAGDSVARTFKIDMPETFVFGYAVDASWVPPTSKPVDDPMEDFPPEANCYEPWQIAVSTHSIGQGLTDQLGWVRLYIDVYDHQGAGTYNAPELYCDDLFDGPIVADFVKSYPGGYARWEVIIGNDNDAVPGDYRCLIRVEDEMYDVVPWWQDPVAYKIQRLTVEEFQQDPGWARTWGSTGTDAAYGTECDQYGNVYVVGEYSGTVDFDPGFYQDEHTSNGASDAFLTKFDDLGFHQWTVAFGGPSVDGARSVAVGYDNGIYVAGRFSETVDFDPSTSTEEETSNGSTDGFVAKFDWEDGHLDWVRTWGGTMEDAADAVSTDTFHNTDIVVGGFFRGTVKFWPSASDSISHGQSDAYIIRFHPNGGFNGRLTWGGQKYDEANCVAMDEDGGIAVTGYFMNNNDSSGVDFNPGSGSDIHVSWGNSDVFLSKFTSSNNFEWARHWGGPDNDSGNGVMMSGASSYNLIYVTGYYQGAIDFDPGSGEYFDASQGLGDVFLVRYDLDGVFDWEKSWGGPGIDTGLDVDSHDYPAPVVTGYFSETCQFDPGPPIVADFSHGGTDAFFSMYTEDGGFILARTWGGPGDDAGRAVGAPYWQRYYVAGYFTGSGVELDPCETVDLHSSNGDTDAFLSKFLWHGCW